MSKTPISILQELMVSRHKGAPFYNIESASSSTGFGFQCIVCADELTATGYGNTKQSAKQNSAQKLLNALGYSVANYELNVNPVINHHVIITQKPSTPLINYVGKLNEFASGKGKPYPEYSESVVPLNGIFTVNCKFASMKAKGNGTTKKLAKQEAAKAMLALLKDANLSDDIVPILDEKKLNNINRLTNEVIKRMAQNFQISNNKRMDNNHTVESRPSLVSGPKARFESIGKLIEYLENKGHKCNISTIQADPYVMIMEIENTSCSSIKWGMHGENNCRIMGQGPTKVHALEDLKDTTELMIANKFSFNVRENNI